MGEKTSIADQAAASNKGPSLNKNLERPSHMGIDINLVGAYEMAWLALHYVQLPPAGHVNENAVSSSRTTKSLILVSSLGGYVDIPMYTDYNSSKCEWSCEALTLKKAMPSSL